MKNILYRGVADLIKEINNMSDVETTAERSNIYRLLSACFYEPERDLFIEENLCGHLQELLEKECPAAAAAAGNMAQALQDSVQVDLAVEHAALFIGPFELPAPPYGSVYLEQSNRLMGDSTMEVKNIYADAGLKLDVQEPPDHISFELEFVHYLFSQEKKALDNKDSDKAQHLATQRDNFLRVYLAPWVPRFCEKIRTATKQIFYQNLADCLEIFINQETISLSHARTDGATKNVYQSTV